MQTNDFCWIELLEIKLFNRLTDSKSLQVARIILSILDDLSHVVEWMVSTRPLISKSSSPFINSSVTVPREPITISINATFMFHCFFFFVFFFNSLARTRGLFFSHFLLILLWSQPGNKVHNFASSLFFGGGAGDYYLGWSSGRD